MARPSFLTRILAAGPVRSSRHLSSSRRSTPSHRESLSHRSHSVHLAHAFAVVSIAFALGGCGTTTSHNIPHDSPHDNPHDGSGSMLTSGDGGLPLESAFEPLTPDQASDTTTGSNLRAAGNGDYALRKATYVEPNRSPIEVIEPTRRRTDRPPTIESLLRSRVAQLVIELEEFRDRKEAKLLDGERLRKHHIVMQLLHIHELLPDDQMTHLDPVLEAMVEPHLPGTEYLHTAAAFFHGIGREDLRDRSMAMLPSTQNPASRGTAGFNPQQRGGTPADPFLFQHLKLCRSVDGYQRYDAYPRALFNRDQQIFVYGELQELSLESQQNAAQQWRFGIKLEVFLLADGKRIDSRVLTNDDWQFANSDTRVNTHFCRPYVFPLGVDPGKYTLEVAVTDLASREQRVQSLPIELLR